MKVLRSVWVRISGISEAVTSSCIWCYQSSAAGARRRAGRFGQCEGKAKSSPASLTVYQLRAYNCFFLWGKLKPTQRVFHSAHQTNKCNSYERPHTLAPGQGLAAWLPLTLKQTVRQKPHVPLGKLWAWPAYWSQSIWKRGKVPLWPGIAILPQRMSSLQAQDMSCTITPLWSAVVLLCRNQWLGRGKQYGSIYTNKSPTRKDSSLPRTFRKVV